jgi:hypothetical protein
VPHPAGGRRGVDAQVLQRLDPARGEPVTADLFAREGGLLEDDDVVCLQTPAGFRAVGQAYADFTPTSDDEVRAALARRGAATP